MRFLYNLALETKKYAYAAHGVNISVYDLKKELPQIKKDFEWLKEINSQSLGEALFNLDAAYDKFFDGIKDGSIKRKKESYIKNRKAKGLKIDADKLRDFGKPKFKSKHDNRHSFSVPQNFELIGNKLWIPKFKTPIEILIHRPIKGEIRNITISKTPSGKYFASILCETNEIIPEKKPVIAETTTGNDLGLKHFIITSEGEKIDNPKYLNESLHKLKRLQKQMSKKVKGSSRYNILKHKIAKLHELISNQRKDFLHKLSDAITKHFDTICFENLNISGMVKNHKLARAISDVGWAMFVTFCKYKAEWRGKNILQIDTFEPSTKECHNCEHINNELTLADREWTCANCGIHHDRDENAAKVIKKKCLRDYFLGEAERSSEDANSEKSPVRLEESSIPKRRRGGKRPDEASKIRQNMLQCVA